jgi:hypothetical protein
MFKKEYNRFSTKQQAKILFLIIRAYMVDRTQEWFQLWKAHVSLKGQEISKKETEEDYKVWISNFFDLEYYYYRQMLMRAKKFNDFYLCLVASYASGDDYDRCFCLNNMTRLADDHNDWQLILRLSFPEDKSYVLAQKMIN